MTTWGTVTTVKAPLWSILDFAAWHLEQGAQRLYLYLDDDQPQTLAVLKAHPKIRAWHTDAELVGQAQGPPRKAPGAAGSERPPCQQPQARGRLAGPYRRRRISDF